MSDPTLPVVTGGAIATGSDLTLPVVNGRAITTGPIQSALTLPVVTKGATDIATANFTPTNDGEPASNATVTITAITSGTDMNVADVPDKVPVTS